MAERNLGDNYRQSLPCFAHDRERRPCQIAWGSPNGAYSIVGDLVDAAYETAMPTMGLLRVMAPVDPKKVASPKEKIPPSEATSQ